MKKIILLGALAMIMLTNSLNAQDIQKEMDAFLRKFETAYNKKNDTALKMLYTETAIWSSADGSTINGNQAIVSSLMDYLTENNVTIQIKQTKTEKQADGSVIGVGTYHLTGKNRSGNIADNAGGYTNTMVKEDGQWKISKSVLTSL